MVGIKGRDRYLGADGTSKNKARYEAEILRWLATKGSAVLQECTEHVPKDDLRISELLVDKMEFAHYYFRKSGRSIGEAENVGHAIRSLCELYRDGPIGNFGQACLKAVRQSWVSARLSRKVVNARINRIRRVFKWGVESELAEPRVLQAAQADATLKKGRTTARETEDVKPVLDAQIEMVFPLATGQVRANIELPNLSGTRPCDVNRGKTIWLYHPMPHLTERHGIRRKVFLGLRAQEILQPFLLRDADSFPFSPCDA